VKDVAMSDVDTSGFPTLYRHDDDSEPASGWVTYLQSVLQVNGQDPGPSDGKFGPRTEAAVQSFQGANGCTPDGVVGNQTWGALHGQQAAPGINRANPHHGGGGGGGLTPDDRSEMVVYFGSDPYYSTAGDCVVLELVTTHARIPSGTLLATLSVADPGGFELLSQNFFSAEDMEPVKYVTYQSIPIRSPHVGEHSAAIVLSDGHGDRVAFGFQPVVDLDQEPEH
jgi:Putative peptidoglycan binding domain